MNILLIGDIVARCGRRAVREVLPDLMKKYQIDFIVANVENLTHGRGFSEGHIKDMQSLGIDFFTSGDHVWDIRESLPLLDDEDSPVVRPANYPPGVPGFGFREVTVGKTKVLIINLIGRVFFAKDFDDPFRIAEEIIKKSKAKVILVDFHAEATSEKNALAWHLDGKASAVVGTHTHIPSCDEKILPKKTAFITDIGMTGNFDSVIGVTPQSVLPAYLTQMPAKFEWGEGKYIFNAVFVSVDEKSGHAKSIERIQVREK
jgi:metallophosphoesterase (TIGR00282 family)